MAAFPKVYAILLSALCIPALGLLAGLIWRGVSFEFRFKADDAHKPFWHRAFIGGSYAAAFFQGVMLGAFIDGHSIVDGVATNGLISWLTPFNVFCGIGVVVAYALLGATCYSGLVISIWPYVLPPSLTIWEAAAPPQSLGFALVGALLIIPFILGYSAWSYYVFRGKVKDGEGYH